jgi:solute carrier family 25 carnitine/acylcarnitine transporter 20/29
MLISIKDFASGALAGVVTVLAGQPFDVIKVKMQTQNNSFKSAFSWMKYTFINEGILGFYRGTLSPLIGITFCVSIQFGSNELAKKYVRKKNKKELGRDELDSFDFIRCGVFSGICTSVAICPIELIIVKLQSSHIECKGTLDCLLKIWKTSKLRGFYQGFNATLFREIPGNTIYFSIYEIFMSISTLKYGSRNDVPFYKILLFGSLAGVSSWIFTYPNDLIKSIIQSECYFNRKYLSIYSVANHVYFRNGIKGFFTGIYPCIIRSIFVNSLAFWTFESAQKLF